MPVKRLLILLIFPLLTGCEFLYELLDIPDPKKEAAAQDAEGRAAGSACRQTGRSLEDCYLLNPWASKASVFAGWREMNDYMLMNEMEIVPSKILQPGDITPGARTVPQTSGANALEPPEAPTPTNPRE